MKPPKFAYHRAASVEDALAMLATPDAKLIAGGQSLMPMLNFRLLRPSVLVDVSRIPGLDAIEELPGGGVRIGALVRHHKVEMSDVIKRRLPVLQHAVTHIGHLAIRNRGTIGGSLSHADPSAEHLLMTVLLDATLTIRSKTATRTSKAADHIAGALSTNLAADEMLVSVEYPALATGTGWAFEEIARRSGDFALAAVGVLMEKVGGKASNVRIAVAGGANGPMRVPGAEKALEGGTCDDRALDAAAEALRSSVEPNSDLQASPELRHRILGTLLRRTCREAWARAGKES